MKAAVLDKKESIIIEDRPIPKTDAESNVLLKVLYCGICGSDMPKYFGNRAKHYPLVLGHEFCGIVEEGPEELKGKLAAGIPLWYCGECDNCKNGNFELCRNHRYIGSTIDGAMQEYITIPDKYILEADALRANPELAALVEPCAVAVHACNLIFDEMRKNKNKSFGIIGDGVIGTLMYLVLRHYGKIYREQIRLIGPKDEVQEDMFDYCFECSGKVGGLNSAIKSTKYKGQIMQLGIVYPEFFKEQELFNFDKLLRKEQNMQGCWNSNFRDDWIEALNIISKFPEEYKKIISRVYNLENTEQAFLDKKYNKEKILKLMIKVGEE